MPRLLIGLHWGTASWCPSMAPFTVLDFLLRISYNLTSTLLEKARPGSRKKFLRTYVCTYVCTHVRARKPDANVILTLHARCVQDLAFKHKTRGYVNFTCLSNKGHVPRGGHEPSIPQIISQNGPVPKDWPVPSISKGMSQGRACHNGGCDWGLRGNCKGELRGNREGTARHCTGTPR